MIFKSLDIFGAYRITPEPFEDTRGLFERVFCREEFKEHNLETTIVQCNRSYNKLRGTLRGMHYQIHPFQEAKIITCLRGSVYDVVLDLRSGETGKWVGCVLKSCEDDMIYIPRGCAHGYQTLEDNSEVFYMTTAPYSPEHSRTIHYKRFDIQWPLPVSCISEKDAKP